jgi:hypothetical protein
LTHDTPPTTPIVFTIKGFVNLYVYIKAAALKKENDAAAMKKENDAAALKKENDAALKEETAEGLAAKKEQIESLQMQLATKMGCTS